MDAAVFLIGIVLVITVIVWLRSKHRDPYDLSRLNEVEDEDPGEAWDDMVNDESGPYCHSCDHPNPLGAGRCLSCGRYEAGARSPRAPSFLDGQD